MTNQQHIGFTIRTERKTRGWTIDESASETGMSVSTIIKIERGDQVRFDSLKRYASAFGLDIEMTIKDMKS